MWVKWNLLSVYLEIVLILTQDRCTVCSEHVVGSEIVWAHPMELLVDMGQVEAHFSMLGDGVNLGVR
jgi:hypothetical protein